MIKTEKYEKIICLVSWLFIVLLFVSIVVLYAINRPDNEILQHSYILFLVLCIIYNGFKTWIVYHNSLYSDKYFNLFRITEVILLSVFMVSFNDGLEYLLLAIPLIFVGLFNKGIRSYLLLALSAIIKMACIFLKAFELNQNASELQDALFTMFWAYVILITMIKTASSVGQSMVKNSQENSRLVSELGEKYEQLEAAQNEIKDQYDKLKDSNHKLEDTNTRLTSSIAEFYTLQQISEAIGSIFDISELLKFVNDVIIGVMGVNYSTIALFDQKKNRLKIHFTNIQNKEDLAILNDNINCKVLLDILEGGNPILENLVTPDNYDFIKHREIGSFITIPLISKSRKFGLIHIEHKSKNAFSEENLYLVTTICKTISMAIENAELYANMQELATIDGLTNVYNRVYFHQKFESELKLAKDLGYNLTLVILDIDFFKKFNDTYGHLFGDVVLKSVAQTIKTNMRSTDTVARFGGEEFVIILPRTTLHEAFEKIESLRLKISNNVVTDNLVSSSVTASFGMASFPETSSNTVELIRDADNALYKAKGNGRNCIRLAEYIGSNE